MVYETNVICMPLLSMLFIGYFISQSNISPVLGSDYQAAIRDRVFNGKKPNLGQLPFLALIHRFIPNNEMYVCTGSIINQKMILSAGHCFKSFVYGNVYLGVVSSDTAILPTSQIFINQTKYIVHPCYGSNKEYNDIESRYDIGILKLNRNIIFTEFVHPIVLQIREIPSSLYWGKIMLVAGYGATFRDELLSDPSLWYTITVVLPNEACGDKLTGRLCSYSTMNSSMCHGDSGGPMWNYDEDGLPMQAAIYSIGLTICRGNEKYMTYVKISTHQNWLHNVIYATSDTSKNRHSECHKWRQH